MADSDTKTLDAETLAADKSAIDACKNITTYDPAKEEYSQTALDAAQLAVTTTETLYNQAKVDFESARDNFVGAQNARHRLVIGMRTQVKAQFGENSNEVQAVGLKKKSEYKSKASRKTTTTTGQG